MAKKEDSRYRCNVMCPQGYQCELSLNHKGLHQVAWYPRKWKKIYGKFKEDTYTNS